MLEISEIMMMEDRETGEAHFDLETGEINMFPVLHHWHIQTLDAETGEFEPEIYRSHSDLKKIFQVPRNALRDSQRSRRRSRSRSRPRVTVVSATHKEESTVKKENTLHARVHHLPPDTYPADVPAYMGDKPVLPQRVGSARHRPPHQQDRLLPPLQSSLLLHFKCMCHLPIAACHREGHTDPG
ncbi:hypothetical protein PR048_010512 [Dryococelus australis]|uniref:Uncharacterized protein n=1 Tax=Dryococelus australis TaxID=614101 RepID=A0ABQ9I2Z6_9NEOP|nr:hypothetical protein PR048_010512 [Dryococelus australis]